MGGSPMPSVAELEALANRLETVANRLEGATAGGVSIAPSGGGGGAAINSSGGGGASGSLTGWAEITNGPLAAYMKLSNEVGDEIAEMSGHFAGGFDAVKTLLDMATQCKKPSDLGSVLTGLQTSLKATAAVRMPKRTSPLDLHYKIIKSAVNALVFV